MKDEEFSELKLKMSVVPEQVQWGEAKYDHQIAVHAAADEARSRVGKLFAEVDAINADINLTSKGKEVARARAAKAALDKLEKSNALQRARDAVAYQCSRWDEKFGLGEILKAPEEAYTISLHAEIRSRVAGMDAQGRLAFLQQHGSSPLVAAALIGGAPNFLSNISDAEAGMIRARLERERVPAEVSEARTATLKALAVTERGWQRATALINERAGLKAERVNLTEQAKANTEAAA